MKAKQSTTDYWKRREEAARKLFEQESERADRELKKIYTGMLIRCQAQIDAWFEQYAAKEGIAMQDARRRVTEIDMERYEALARKYVRDAAEARRKNNGMNDYSSNAYSNEAAEQMRLYNLTMKVNRLELLKSQVGMEMVDSFYSMQNMIGGRITDEAIKEYTRLAGILGRSVRPEQARRGAAAVANGDFHGATWSERIWNHQDELKSRVDILLQQAIIAGKNSHQIAKELQKAFDVSQYNAERLMHTEVKRVRTEMSRQIMEENGNEEYIYLALGRNPCPVCLAIHGNIYKLKDMMAGKNAPPMHPNCECTTASHWDENKYQEWINSGAAKDGTPFDGYIDSSNKYEERERNIRFGKTESFSQIARPDIRASKVESSTNNLYIDDEVKLSKKEIRFVDAVISSAKDAVGVRYDCDAKIVVTNNRGRIASYNPVTNVLFLDVDCSYREKLIASQIGYAKPDDARSSMVHELLHWKEADEYRKKIGKIDSAVKGSPFYAYIQMRALEKIRENGLNDLKVEEISRYAWQKYIDNDFDEVYTEFRTVELLGG